MIGPAAALAALAEDSWGFLCEREAYYAAKSGRPVEQIAAGSLQEAEAVATNAQEQLRKLQAIDLSHLDRTDRLTHSYLRYHFQTEVAEPARWHTDFSVTPYTFGGLAMLPSLIFARINLSEPGEGERYLSLVGDLVVGLHEQRNRLEIQAADGWCVPRPALAGSRTAIAGTKGSICTALRPAEDRGAPSGLQGRIAARIDDELAPAFDALLAALDEVYERRSGELAGLCHLPRGEAAYRNWMQFHLSFEISPDDVHRVGREEVSRLSSAMAEVRSVEFGFDGEEDEFHRRLRDDAKAKAASPEALEARFRGHLDRMRAKLPNIIKRMPNAAYDVARLAPALEAGMTYGYYNAPERAGEAGLYYYSAANLDTRLQLVAAPLIYHELLPGHHVHITRQAENESLPSIRREVFAFSAFNEGWAEYSAGLGEEQGLYENKYDRYGWLAHQRFVSQRLVVDTGLNAFGWTLDEAASYMSANTLEGPEQVASEVLRYSTDLPGQSLAYRLGFLKFRGLREKAAAKLGPEFNQPDFHEAILEQGSLPLSVLEQSLVEWTEERALENC